MRKALRIGLVAGVASATVLACTGNDPVVVASAPAPDGSGPVVDASVTEEGAPVDGGSRCQTFPFPRPVVESGDGWTFRSDNATFMGPSTDETTVDTVDNGYGSFVLPIERRDTVASVTVRGQIRLDSGGTGSLAPVGIVILDGSGSTARVDLVRTDTSLALRRAPDNDDPYEPGNLYEFEGASFESSIYVPFSITIRGPWDTGPTLSGTVRMQAGKAGTTMLGTYPTKASLPPALAVSVGVTQRNPATRLTLTEIAVDVCRQ